jgi:ATP-dependent DNA helicase RecG
MPEQQNIEYKQSWHDDYLKWVCGFANAVGGKIYIGKNDAGQVVHLADYKSLMDTIPQKIRNSMGVVCDVNLLEEGEKKYIEIKVNAYTVPVSLRGRYYYRTGSTNVELTGIELNEFLLKKAGKTWDDVVEERATISDIDTQCIDKYIEASKEKSRMPDTSGLKPIQILDKLRLTEGNKLKRAALILFAKDPNRFYPNIQVKIGRFGKDSTDLRFQEIVEGNLVQMLEAVQIQLNYKFLTRPVEFVGMQRIEKNQYPIEALREMLLNAMVHRTYMGAPIQIRVYDDRLSIWNEGILPLGLSLEDLKVEHNSRPRNPKIADACFLAGYIDTWGRGTLKIINACKEAGLPAPEIKEMNGGVEVTLFNRIISNQDGNQDSNQDSNQDDYHVGKQKLIITLKDLLHAISVNSINFTQDELKNFRNIANELSLEQLKILEFTLIPKKKSEILIDCLGLSNQTKNFRNYVVPLLERKLIQMTLPDKPNSLYQKYFLTKNGRGVLYVANQNDENL